jgi:hypothetical protein
MSACSHGDDRLAAIAEGFCEPGFETMVTTLSGIASGKNPRQRRNYWANHAAKMNNGALDLTELGRRLVEAVKMEAAQVTRTETHEVLRGAVEHVFDPPRHPTRMSCRCSRC